jgi:signal transduction histidine kinase
MLENLINDLLDLAKMENNSFRFDNNFFSLQETVYQAFSMLNFSANEREVKLRAVVD